MSCTILQFSNEAAQTGLFLVAISWKSSKEKGYLEVNGRGENTKSKWGNTFPARLNVRLQFKEVLMVGSCCQILMSDGSRSIPAIETAVFGHLKSWIEQILSGCKTSNAPQSFKWKLISYIRWRSGSCYITYIIWYMFYISI